MNMTKSIALVAITTFIVSLAQAEMRTWTDTFGNKTEAKFVENRNGTVTLANAEGQEAQISISQLSADDQKYVLVNTPPEIKIQVNELTNRQNKGFAFENPNNSAYDRDIQIQTTERSFRVTLTKGSIPYTKPIKAELYVIGYRKRAEEFVLLDKTVADVDFDQPDSKNKFSFVSDGAETKSMQGGFRAGVSFHGYLVALVDENNRVFEARASRAGMREHAAMIRRIKEGQTVKKAEAIQMAKEEEAKQKAQD
jgi:hypothetical protein